MQHGYMIIKLCTCVCAVGKGTTRFLPSQPRTLPPGLGLGLDRVQSGRFTQVHSYTGRAAETGGLLSCNSTGESKLQYIRSYSYFSIIYCLLL